MRVLRITDRLHQKETPSIRMGFSFWLWQHASQLPSVVMRPTSVARWVKAPARCRWQMQCRGFECRGRQMPRSTADAGRCRAPQTGTSNNAFGVVHLKTTRREGSTWPRSVCNAAARRQGAHREPQQDVGSISDTPRVQALAMDDWLGGTYAGSEASRCPASATRKEKDHPTGRSFFLYL